MPLVLAIFNVDGVVRCLLLLRGSGAAGVIEEETGDDGVDSATACSGSPPLDSTGGVTGVDSFCAQSLSGTFSRSGRSSMQRR